MSTLKSLLAGLVASMILVPLTFAAESEQEFKCRNGSITFMLLFDSKRNVVFSQKGQDIPTTLGESSKTTLSYFWNQFENNKNGVEAPDILVFDHYVNEAYYSYSYVPDFFGLKLPADHETATCEKVQSSLM